MTRVNAAQGFNILSEIAKELATAVTDGRPISMDRRLGIKRTGSDPAGWDIHDHDGTCRITVIIGPKTV
jgi:hypothetical protein